MSPYQPKVLGTTIFGPADTITAQVRSIMGILPSNTDVTQQDQVLDESSGTVYRVTLVTQQGNIGGMVPDMVVSLQRVTTTQPV
jgi:hypothetical protein